MSGQIHAVLNQVHPSMSMHPHTTVCVHDLLTTLLGRLVTQAAAFSHTMVVDEEDRAGYLLAELRELHVGPG